MNLKYGINLLVPLLTRSVIGRDVLAQLHDVDRTIMFTDSAGYSTATDRLGDHRAQSLVRIHNQIVRSALAEHGGIEVKHTGDGKDFSFRLVAEEPLEGLSEPQRLYAVERPAREDRAAPDGLRRRAITAVGGLS